MKNIASASTKELIQLLKDKLNISIPNGINMYYNIQYKLSSSLVEYRKINNMSQLDMAKRLDITQAMVSNYESGDYNISLQKLCDLCEKLRWELKFEFDSDIRFKNDVDFYAFQCATDFDAEIAEAI